MKVDPKTASEIIKSRIVNQPLALEQDPMEVHRMIYLNHVCQFLHLEPNPMNLNRVVSALEHYGIETNNFQEYPKEVDGRVVQTKEEHDALASEHSDRVRDELNPTETEPERDPLFADEPKREVA